MSEVFILTPNLEVSICLTVIGQIHGVGPGQTHEKLQHYEGGRDEAGGLRSTSLYGLPVSNNETSRGSTHKVACCHSQGPSLDHSFSSGPSHVPVNVFYFLFGDTNLVLDSATQSWTGHKSGTSNVYPLSNITKR